MKNKKCINISTHRYVLALRMSFPSQFSLESNLHFAKHRYYGKYLPPTPTELTRKLSDKLLALKLINTWMYKIKIIRCQNMTSSLIIN